jgi:hypothetical protein
VSGGVRIRSISGVFNKISAFDLEEVFWLIGLDAPIMENTF